VKETFDDEELGHIIGGTTENADSAKVENKLFFNKVKEYLLASNNPELESLTVLNGINLRHIFLGDLFHVDNEAPCHSSFFVIKSSPTKKHTLDVIDILSAIWVHYKADKEVDRTRKAKKTARTKVIAVLVGSVKKVDHHYTTGLKNEDHIEHIWEEKD